MPLFSAECIYTLLTLLGYDRAFYRLILRLASITSSIPWCLYLVVGGNITFEFRPRFSNPLDAQVFDCLEGLRNAIDPIYKLIHQIERDGLHTERDTQLRHRFLEESPSMLLEAVMHYEALQKTLSENAAALGDADPIKQCVNDKSRGFLYECRCRLDRLSHFFNECFFLELKEKTHDPHWVEASHAFAACYPELGVAYVALAECIRELVARYVEITVQSTRKVQAKRMRNKSDLEKYDAKTAFIRREVRRSVMGTVETAMERQKDIDVWADIALAYADSLGEGGVAEGWKSNVDDFLNPIRMKLLQFETVIKIARLDPPDRTS